MTRNLFTEMIFCCDNNCSNLFQITGTLIDTGLIFSKEVISNQSENGHYRHKIDLSQYDFSRKTFVAFTVRVT